MAAPSRPPPSLVDPGAEAALLGTFMRDPHRLDDRRVHRSLFASPPHLLVFDALRAAHDHGELAGDLLTASAALEANPQIPLPRSFSADAFDAADLALPDALLTHVAKLARRRQLRSLSLGLAAVAEHPHPDDDSETLATIAARTAELASNGAAPHPWLSIADSPTTAVSWLWSRRIPHGTLSLLDGDPGLGKTALALELAARVSIGFALPDDPEPPWPPAGVVLVNAEDSIATTIRPRLEAAGADLTRIVAFDLNHIPILPDGLPLLREALLDTHASLLIIDPVLAVLSASIDAYRDHDVRRFLHPLAALAEETNVAVLLVRHLTKQSGPKALYRGGGAIAFSGAARSVLLVAPDPDAPDSTRVLAPIKNNLSPMASALSFTLEPTPSSFRIAFTGPSQLRADQLVAPPHDDDDPDAVSFAVSFLRDLLASGPVESSLADKRRRQLSISDYAWKRARSRLHISAVKESFSGGWCLQLPHG
jgi:AAA domain